MFKTKSLTPSQYDIIINKSTEQPFTGRYNDQLSQGVYICRQCSTKLFKDDNKFISTCGWPSYDFHIDDNVKTVPDVDGNRTEIVCNGCDAHLGHIFQGEGFTKLNSRYCVNSASVDFIPHYKFGELEEIILAAGCFWGVEYYLKKLDGVLLTESGYSGGSLPNPNYKVICNGNSDYLEVVRIIFDKRIISLENILKYFFEIHDFEQINGQGPDIGKQYQSSIFCYTDEQILVSTKLIQILQEKKYHVATTIREAQPFYIAEEEHLDFYFKNASIPYCHSHKKIF